MIREAADEAPAPNVLAVADRSASVAEYEQQFGGKRLVETALFYDGDGRLLPPLPEMVIVEGSPIDKAYSDVSIEHRVATPQSLIAKGYCNSFLLKLATSAERGVVESLQAARCWREAGAERPAAAGGEGATAIAAEGRDRDCGNKPCLRALRRRGPRSRPRPICVAGYLARRTALAKIRGSLG